VEREATHTAWRIRKLLSLARQATGDIGATSLGHEYHNYATREARTATVLRRWAIAVTGVIAVLAFWFNARLSEATIAVELLRLSVAIPLAALAGYLARESSKHRREANWARERAIALHTMPAYVAESNKDDGHALRQALGMRVFGAPADRPDSASDPATAEHLSAPVQKIAEEVRGIVDTMQGLGDVIAKRDSK